MALTEEDLSIILQPTYPSEGLLSMSLATAMLNTSSAMDSSSRDVFSTQLGFSPLQKAHSMGGPAINMNLCGMPERSRGISSQWPAFSSDEKWEIDGKDEVLDRASGPGYGAALQQPSGLQRYHSGPSSFLQSLAESCDDDFAHVTNPLDDSRLKYLTENLAPIMESAQSRWGNKLEPEKLGANPMNKLSTEQYFAIQVENVKQSATSRASEVNPRLGVSNQSQMPVNDLFAGKRVRFSEEMTDDSTSDLLLGDDRNRRRGILSRQQSLPLMSTKVLFNGENPNFSTDLADDLLDVFASCKTRSRRGYATHPRSIAERNRRGRISKRMKKLQDLVPNMDKQTNTAEMLDEAVEYVKFLQDQVEELSETIVHLKDGI